MADSNESPDLPGMVVAEQTHLSLPSFPHWIEAAVEYLRHKAVLSGACQESRSAKLMMALHEALSNAIVHGNLELSSDLKERGDNKFAEALAQRVADPRYSDREVEILIDCNLERCRWTVTDQGQGFDVDGVLRKKLSDDPEDLLSSGRGILIMRSFLDEVTYERGGRRLLLTLRRTSGQEKRLHPRVPIQQTVQVVPVLSDGTVDWNAAYEAVARNFSERGVSLLQGKMTDAAQVACGHYHRQSAGLCACGGTPLQFSWRSRGSRLHLRAPGGRGARQARGYHGRNPRGPSRSQSSAGSAFKAPPSCPITAVSTSALCTMNGSRCYPWAPSRRWTAMRTTCRAAALLSSPPWRFLWKSPSFFCLKTAARPCACALTWSAAPKSWITFMTSAHRFLQLTEKETPG